MSAPLLTTKLYIPPPRSNFAPRAHLIARLDAALSRALTLISAPAGFGKTTLLSAWLVGCGRPAVDEALAFLIEHLPPQLHLVIATREDPHLPLARLRARGQLSELRASDLRFTPAEAAEFLNRVMGLNLADDVMELKDIATPAPGAGLVLIRVRAASLAAGDYLGMRGRPFPVRLFVGFPRPRKDYVVGLDCAGIVEAVGPDVHQFQPGDAVYGECRGACAEYALAREGNLALMPANLSFEDAAAVPTSACTALQGLRDHGKVQPGHKVLINGASGGVGPFAVQIARALGAEVTGVCSTRNVELVRSLGTMSSTTPERTSPRPDSATTASWTMWPTIHSRLCGACSPRRG